MRLDREKTNGARVYDAAPFKWLVLFAILAIIGFVVFGFWFWRFH